MHATRYVVLVAAMVITGACAPSGADAIRCRKDAHCPSGFACSAEGVCVEGQQGRSGERLVVQPSSVTLKAGTTQQFLALVDDEQTSSVTWTVDGPGTISPAGVYSPPAQMDVTTQVTVRAALTTDEALVASALVTVAPNSENLVPITLSLNPASVALGSATVSLKVEGSAFVSSSKVYVGQTLLSTTYESATLLAAVLPAGLLQTAAELPVTVQSPAPGGGTSNAQTFTVLNPLPTITAVSPTEVNVDSPEFVLTVDGSGFVPSSVVYLDDQPLSTQRLSATKLQATVPAARVAIGRVAAVDVRNPAPGGGDAADASLNVRNPSASTGSVSPVSVLAGSGSTTLTLTGSNIRPGATVHFDGQPLAAQWVSSTQVTVALPAALTATSRTIQLKVVNSAPGGGGMNAIPFRILPVLQTVAGVGNVEGRPATSVPMALESYDLGSTVAAVHPLTGEIYYSECRRHRIMRIDAQGLVQRVAGTGVCTSDGEGGPAKDAGLCCPTAMAFDPSGNLFVMSVWHDRLVKIAADAQRTLTGVLRSIELSSANGLAVHPTTNDLYLSICYGNGSTRHSIQRLDGTSLTRVAGNSTYGSTGDGGQATSASLMCPAGITFDGAGKLFIAELEAHKVRMVDTNGVISTYAGNGSTGSAGDGGPATAAAVSSPTSVLTDADGNLYIAQFADRLIRKVTPAGTISKVAGVNSSGMLATDGESALTGRVGHVSQLFWGANGQLHFVTAHEWGQERNAIGRIDAFGGVQTVVGGWHPNTSASDSLFTLPTGLAVDSGGNVYVSSVRDGKVYRVDASGTMTHVAGNGLKDLCGDGGPATQACLHNPNGLWLDDDGNLFIADTYNFRIRRVDPLGIITTVAGGGEWPAGCPSGTPTSPPAGAGAGYNCIGDAYLAAQAILVVPDAVFGDNEGNLYIAEADGPGWMFPGTGNRVRRVDLVTGVITTIAGSTAPTGGTCGFSGDGGQSTVARLCEPSGMTLNPQGDLVVADSRNSRVRRIRLKTAPLGVIDTIAGDGDYASTDDGAQATSASLRWPKSVAYDPSGNLYISDQYAANIRRVAPTGIISTVAGLSSGDNGYSPDGREPRGAALWDPYFVAVSPDGQTLYFTESEHHLVRKFGL